ncbi:MAG: YfhO family protein [Deltaproteobacteria bacterium]|nr:YfhO family protein [Deltaproteobacteria bacterium]
MTAALSSPRRPWLAPALFALAAAAVLAPSVLGSAPIYGFDTVQEKFFWRSWAYARIANGEWPWWCAGLVGGFPLTAEPITQFWYPPVAVLHLLFPIGRALNLTWWVHLTWGGLGMYRLLRSRRLGAPAAGLGGLAYGLSGWMVGHVPMGGLPHLASCAWAPWLLTSLLRVVEGADHPRPRDVAVAALAFGASLLAGHAQFTYGALLFFVIFVPLVRVKRGGGARSDGGTHTATVGRVLALALALALGAALAATMLVPYAKLLAASNRGEALPAEFADFGARLPLVQLLGAYAPSFFGGSRGVSYWGFPTREAVTPYLGIVPLALALSPVPRRARREAWALRMIGVFGLVLAMGPATPVLGLLRSVAPLVDRARHPARWLELSILAGSWLAAWGAQRIIEWTGETRLGAAPHPQRGPGGTGLVIVAACALATWWAIASGSAATARYGSLVASRIDESSLAEGDALRSALPAALEQARECSEASCLRALAYAAAALGLVAAARLARQSRGAAWALVGLTAIDLVSLGRREIVPFDQTALPWPDDIAHTAADASPEMRIATAVPGARFPFPSAFRGSHEILSRIGQADMHRPLLVGAATPQGGIPTTPVRWLRLAVGVGSYDFNYTPVGPRTVVDRLSVGLLITAPGQRPEGADWTRVVANEQQWLWRNTNALRRASLVHRCVALAGPDQVLHTLRDPRRELPDGVALISGACPPGIEARDPGEPSTESVRWLEATDERVILETAASSGALLRLADAAMPGWSATVDDVAAQIHTVDFALRGVVVPPGTHRVVFHYRPAAAWLGILVSVTALCAVGMLLALPDRRTTGRCPSRRDPAPVTGG